MSGLRGLSWSLSDRQRLAWMHPQMKGLLLAELGAGAYPDTSHKNEDAVTEPATAPTTVRVFSRPPAVLWGESSLCAQA